MKSIFLLFISFLLLISLSGCYSNYFLLPTQDEKNVLYEAGEGIIVINNEEITIACSANVYDTQTLLSINLYIRNNSDKKLHVLPDRLITAYVERKDGVPFKLKRKKIKDFESAAKKGYLISKTSQAAFDVIGGLTKAALTATEIAVATSPYLETDVRENRAKVISDLNQKISKPNATKYESLNGEYSNNLEELHSYLIKEQTLLPKQTMSGSLVYKSGILWNFDNLGVKGKYIFEIKIFDKTYKLHFEAPPK